MSKLTDDRRWISTLADDLNDFIDTVDNDLSSTDQTDMPEVVDSLSDLHSYLEAATAALLKAHTELCKLEAM